MRYRFAGLAVVALALAFSATPRAGQATRTAAAQKLPPLSYVCPMPQDAVELENKFRHDVSTHFAEAACVGLALAACARRAFSN